GEVVEALSQSGKKVSSRSHSGEEPVRTPRPVTDDWVNEAGHRDTIEKVADKSGATDHRAGSDRRAGVREGELEEPECQERHARRLVRCWSIFQEEPVISDESVPVAEHERGTERVKEESAQTGVDDALHQHVHGLARAAEPGFEHGEAHLHSENEEGSDECPGSVDGVDDIRDFDLWSSLGGIEIRKRKAGDKKDHGKSRQNPDRFA